MWIEVEGNNATIYFSKKKRTTLLKAFHLASHHRGNEDGRILEEVKKNKCN